MDERLNQALGRLRQIAEEEKAKGDRLMTKPWSHERDTFANQSYYAADVLEDAVSELEAMRNADSASTNEEKS